LAKNKVLRYGARIMTMLAVGIMISIIMITDISTYSWFASTATGTAHVSAAETEDIIESIEYIPEEKIDPDNNKWSKPYIKIKKNPDFEKLPILFFEITGEAANYILHINPVLLESDDYYRIPVETDVNVIQYGQLCTDLNGTVTGTLTVKYLNNFINESIPIAISKEYLSNRIYEKIIRDEVGPIEEDEPAIATMAMNKLSKRTLKVLQQPSMDSITVKAIASLADLVQWQNIEVISDDGEISSTAVFKAALNLSFDQDMLLDIMFPGLKDYMAKLIAYAESLEVKLAEKSSVIDGLRLQIALFADRIAGLEAENAELQSKVEELSAQLAAYQAAVPPVISPPAAPGTVIPPAAPGGTVTPPSGGSTNTPSAPDVAVPPASGDTGTPPAGDNSGAPPTGPPAVNEPSVPEEVPQQEEEYPSDSGEPQPSEEPQTPEEPQDEGGESQEPAGEEQPSEPTAGDNRSDVGTGDSGGASEPESKGDETPADNGGSTEPSDSGSGDSTNEN